MTEVYLFTAAVSHAVNIAKAIVETHDEMKLRDLKLEFTTALLEVTQKQLALTQGYQSHLDANEKLKKQLAAYERWEQESNRYQLHELQPGILVYALKPEHASGQPAHWLCATCYNEGKKTILQRHRLGSEIWECPRNSQHSIDAEERRDRGMISI